MERKRVVITDLTEEGSGVARIDGKVTFVRDALPGEDVEVEVTSERKKFNLARVVHFHKWHPDRVVPFCRHYGSCGGCSLQHLDYNAGLEYKRKWVKASFAKIAGIEIKLPEIVGMVEHFHYRNKVVFHGFFLEGRFHLGFYKKNSKVLLPISECGLLPPVFLEIKAALESLFGLYNCYPREVTLRTDGEQVVVLVDSPLLDNLALVGEELRVLFPLVSHFVYDEESGEGVFLEMRLGERTFLVSPWSFFQVNTRGALALFGGVRSLLEGAPGEGVLFDLFCGVGSVGIFLGDLFREVRGLEVHEPAVELARENALRNGLLNCSFKSGRVEELVAAGTFGRDGLVVLDPPRAGVEPGVIEALLGSDVRRVVYIGCGLGKMVRDVDRFCQGGFGVSRVFCADMFPWTGHVETCVLLSHKNS